MRIKRAGPLGDFYKRTTLYKDFIPINISDWQECINESLGHPRVFFIYDENLPRL